MKGELAMIVEFRQQNNGFIDVATLKSSVKKLDAGLISPATEETECELAPEHAAEPIKKMDDIIRVSDYLISNGRYRDNMLFIVGINFGLRVSDLRMLRFSNLINENLTFKDSFPVFEKKTRNTRKRKLNRYITVNTAVIEAVTLYLEHTQGVSLSDYMFRSQSTNGLDNGKPLERWSIDRILKNVAKECDLNVKVSTHTLRKTFAYWVMVRGGNDQRRLLLLQKIFGHSSPEQTLQYIGISREEISEAYQELNLGSMSERNLIDCKIVEFSAEVV